MRTIPSSLGFVFSFVFSIACGNNHPNPREDAPTSNKLCGGLAPQPCAQAEYCDFANNSCGSGDQTGICKPRPEFCALIAGPPTCGCNGMVYPNECIVFRDGTDLNARGSCTIEAGKFACGYVQCSLDTQYCLREVRASGADTYSCAGLPACATQPPDCGCLARERCGNRCAGSASTGLTLTCG